MKLLYLFSLAVVLASLPLQKTLAGTNAPLEVAVVYHGPGACPPCAVAADEAAHAAGLKVVTVTGKESIAELQTTLAGAKVWIQPGGTSASAIQQMSTDYLDTIRSFISLGGGYVGFCAGAFLTTELNGTTDLHALGIVPGKTIPLFVDGSKDDHAYAMSISFDKYPHRQIYFNGGPYFDLTGVTDPNLKVTATYDDYENKVAGISTLYGKGKISVLGAHPEELPIMKFFHGVDDKDGNDQFIAVEMIQSVIQ